MELPITATLDDLAEYHDALIHLPRPARRKELRQAAGLPLAKAASLVGVSPAMLARWEEGRANPEMGAATSCAGLIEHLRNLETMRRKAQRNEDRKAALIRQRADWLDEVTGICGHTIEEWQEMRRAAGLPT